MSRPGLEDQVVIVTGATGGPVESPHVGLPMKGIKVIIAHDFDNLTVFSHASSFITGAVISVDGGLVLGT